MPAVQLTARALLLDMDGTLVDSAAAVERVWRGWATETGLDPERVLAVMPGRQGHATMAELLPDRPVELNLADARRMLAQETADLADIVPIPGAAEFLAAVEPHPHALVTSADVPLATARMTAAGLRIPDIRITQESVSASKPDPEGFLKAAAELGVAPADCVVFEDSLAGIAAARAAGMRVVGVGASAAAHGPTAWVATLRGVTLAAGADRVLTLRVA
ncbi:HAD family hydrolase [Streptomyces sp. 8K308]|uniref:HAD-IA family hydrolase n=1 Tax=Streptomyces sp. 8K308 TaxID=2530388 RepID=UPI00104C603C|nr:HAD-IA family hydrolase [Streptomyces sp. 8K308]TDC05830.1 HAD family hydrolase [Streptomyces sp. 8K308]